LKPDEVLLILKKAEEREILKKENLKLKERIRTITTSYHFGKLMAKSTPMQSVFKIAAKAAQFDTTVLIMGESGTGKELVTKGTMVLTDKTTLQPEHFFPKAFGCRLAFLFS
jgi:two-component system, NtrC family, response regulator AtoC